MAGSKLVKQDEFGAILPTLRFLAIRCIRYVMPCHHNVMLAIY